MPVSVCSTTLPIRRRRLCQQHTPVNPELAPLYPDELSALLLPPIDDASSSSEVIVVGRSRPLHSRKKRTYAASHSSTLIERLNRTLQRTMGNMRSPTPDVLDLQNHQFIPSKIKATFATSDTPSTQPQPVGPNTPCTPLTRSPDSPPSPSSTPSTTRQWGSTTTLSSDIDHTDTSSCTSQENLCSTLQTEETMKTLSTTTTSPPPPPKKNRRTLTMIVHPPPPLRLHKMVLRSTTRRNKLLVLLNKRPRWQQDKNSIHPQKNHTQPPSPPISPKLNSPVLV